MRSIGASGFTLLELIVNIAIIGLLVAIAIPAYTTFRDRARIATVRADLKNIQLAMEALAIDTEKWPGPQTVGVTADQEVWDLSTGSAGLVKTSGGFPNWKGPYMQSVPKDPWGKNYFFDPDYYTSGQMGVGPQSAVIGSFGPNKCCQNTYDSDNIYLLLPAQ
jgi:general secretion pathway protein G